MIKKKMYFLIIFGNIQNDLYLDGIRGGIGGICGFHKLLFSELWKLKIVGGTSGTSGFHKLFLNGIIFSLTQF